MHTNPYRQTYKPKHLLLKIAAYAILFTGFFAILLTSCRKEDFYYETEGKLNFSGDTVLFDTVFTTIGSTTKYFKVYNPHNKTIRINSLFLGGGTGSNFRINVDGSSGVAHTNIEIAPKDSMYIFVRVTVDPNSTLTPFIVSDSLIFSLNNSVQQIKLVAWGQNAYFHTPVYYPNNMSPYAVISGQTIWTNDKPHLVYGWVVIDSAATLTIQEGTRIHFHNNSGMWVYKDGTLKVEGTLDNPVTFQGDRLDAWYQDIPGQWGRLMYNGHLFSMGIWLSSGSVGNEINYAIIRNGDTGLKVDTIGNSPNPTLKLRNTIIENMSTAGIYAQGSFIEAENVLIHNCGLHALILSIGGNYNFRHCTFANYWSFSTRQTASVVINNYYKDVNNNIQVRDLVNAYFGNCIIYGSIDEEILLDNHTSGLFNFSFDHCLLKTQNNTADPAFYINSIVNTNPQFRDAAENDYRLNASSPAIDAGSINIAAGVPFDILGVPRTSAPDIGAYERE